MICHFVDSLHKKILIRNYSFKDLLWVCNNTEMAMIRENTKKKDKHGI